MQKVKNTNIKLYSKVREYSNADAVDIVYDVMDFTRAESIKNGTQISRQKGSRRLIDRNRNAIAHEVVDYSQFKVTKIESGVTVDNSKKEKQLETAALSLLADLGIDWSEDEEIEDDSEQEKTEPETVENESDNTVENESEQTVSNEESEDSQEIPDDFDSLIASILGDAVENDEDNSDDNWDDPNQFTEDEMSELFDKLMADI